MAKRILRDYEQVSLRPENLAGRIDFQKIFGRKAPVHIEIGSGKGTFLVSQARHRPEVNFLGIEWAGKYYRFAVDRIGRWNLSNVRIIRTDAADFLTDHVPDSSVQWFHIYFPDPWPKKRHHKRRLFDANFVAAAAEALTPAGQLHVVTDYKEYFDIIGPLLARCVQLQLSDFTPGDTAQLGEWVGTNFERKYLAQGRTIYSCTAQKITGPQCPSAS